jgi:hypothetical protein
LLECVAHWLHCICLLFTVGHYRCHEQRRRNRQDSASISNTTGW